MAGSKKMIGLSSSGLDRKDGLDEDEEHDWDEWYSVDEF